MSKNAWSPGRIRRSVKLCGCGEQRSPEMELIASTQSEPISYSRAVASATISDSFTPGFSASAMSWYTPSTMAAAMLSSVSSSMFFTSRACSITCWPSRTSMPSFCSSNIIGGSTTSRPSGMSPTPSASRIALISFAASRKSVMSPPVAPRNPRRPALQ